VTQPTEAGVGAYVGALVVDQAARRWRVVVACPDHGRLPAALARAGIAHRPAYGWPSDRGSVDLVRRGRCGRFPSRWEGLPLTLLEALAVGRSIVGTDIPGIAEVLPADAGVLVPLGDEAALADAVALRLGDTGQAGREGDAGRAFAEREADIRRTHDRLAALVDRVANGVEQRRSRTS